MLTKHAEILDISVKQLAVLPQTIFHLLRALPLVHLSRARRQSLRLVVLHNLSSVVLPELESIPKKKRYRMRDLSRVALVQLRLYFIVRLGRPEIQIARLRLHILYSTVIALLQDARTPSRCLQKGCTP